MAASTSECPVCGVQVRMSEVAAHVAECLDTQGFSAASIRRSANQAKADPSKKGPQGSVASRPGKLSSYAPSEHAPTPGGPGEAAPGGSGAPHSSFGANKKASLEGWTMVGDASLDPSDSQQQSLDPLDSLKQKLRKVRTEMQEARKSLGTLREQRGVGASAPSGGVHTHTPLQEKLEKRVGDSHGDDFGFCKLDQSMGGQVAVPLQLWNKHGSVDAEKYHRSKERKQLIYEKQLASSWERLEVPCDPAVVAGKMKFLVRRGVPDSYRRKIWLAQCGYFLRPEKDHIQTYDNLRREVFGEVLPHTHFTVPLFGSESFQPGLFLHRDSELRVYQRVLCVLATHNADVDFCPSLPPLVGILLMFLDEHEAFFVAQHLLRSALQPDADPMNIHLSRNLKALRLKILTFRDLLAKRLAPVASHLAMLGVNIVDIAEMWFSRLFVGVFPLSTVLRIFDAFMLEGHSVLFRIGLALFANIKGTVMRCQSKEMMLTALEQVCMQYHSHDALIKKAFSFHFLQRHINRFCESNKQNIADVMEPQFQVYYRPHMDTPSSILLAEEVEILYMFLPSRLRIMDMRLVYSVDQHGYSLKTFLNMTEGVYPTVLLIKTEDVRCFGAFVGQPWHKSLQPYGSRDSFLFTVSPVPCKFEWDQNSNDSFMYVSEKKGISLGAGGDGAGLYIDADLARGTSAYCETYDNAPLCGPLELLKERRFEPSDSPSTSSEASMTGTTASVDSFLSSSPTQWSTDFEDFEWSSASPNRAADTPSSTNQSASSGTPGGPDDVSPPAASASAASSTSSSGGARKEKEYSFVPLKIEVYTFA